MEGKKEEEEKTKTIVENEFKDSIHGEGLLEFSKDLGVIDDDDPVLLMMAWKLKSEVVWEISQEEFMNGFTIHACASMDKIKAKAKEWREELKNNQQNFKNFYNFVFDYLKEDKKILLVDEAIIAWNILMKDRKWPLMASFIEFIKSEEKKSISRDVWQQLWHFQKTYPQNLKEYDPNSSWPILYDEFVEWMNLHKM